MIKLPHAVAFCVGTMGLVCGCAMGPWVATSEGRSPGTGINKNTRVPASELFPAVKLRGYGTVSGKSLTVAAPSGKASLLDIRCADEASAKLLCAKYLSDVAVLPGVSSVRLATSAGQVAARDVTGQGCIAAGRSGTEVVIVAAGSNADLAWMIGQTSGLEKAVWESETQVPMWLDRWDLYSFRHYYWAWQLPKGQTEATYDYIHEFDYAQQNRAGILLNTGSPLATDSADGMVNTGFAGWVVEEARKRNLPVDIHIAAGTSEPTWFLNRYRAETQMKMPDFTGNYHTLMSPYLGGQGVLSWSATTAEDDRLARLQKTIRCLTAGPNVTSILEPHGELKHGKQDIFLEYGPVADADYRRYLQGKYGTLNAVAERWGRSLKSWDEVRVPEVAAFAGWGPQALDVDGTWRAGFEELTEPLPADFDWAAQRTTPKSKPAPEEWFKADFDDSNWPEMPGAGNDKLLFLAKRYAVLRRQVEVPADWRAKNGRVWLYLWDLNMATDAEVRVVVNGSEVGRSKIAFVTPHSCAMEVTSVLQAGKNTLAIRLPQGYIAYKTYLSPIEPRQYPNLGEHLNAQWVDFVDFTGWSRVKTVRRGMEMIRQAAPNPGITLMAPDAYADGIKAAAEDYGGEFRNTGYMGGMYADSLPALMRGANLPFSTEPGGPAKDLADFKKQLGLWQTEGVQSLDYFIHIGSILWNPEIKAEFEAQRKQLSLMGQSHYAKAEVACFYSDRIAELTGYPWGSAFNQNLGSGYWNWNAGSVLRGYFPYDGLSPSSFKSGDADAYRVIIDSNTSIMDEAMVSDIERWVRAGGTFVTLAQTGRHTPEKPDSWPMARLTGYQVARIDRLKPDGGVDETGVLQPAPEQQVFSDSWKNVRANGLHMTKAAADATNLLLWSDGSVAAGVRPLGKGLVVQLGAKFTGAKINDRVEPGANTPEVRQLRQMLTAILDWQGVKPEAGRVSPDNEQVWVRPAVSNNGLYNTWTVRNWSPTKTQTASIVLGKGNDPAFAVDVRSGKQIPVTASADGARIETIVLEPLDTRVFLTPRGQITQAPAAWFELQRNWWRGGAQSDSKPLPAPVQRFASELTEDWKFKTLEDAADATPLLAAHLDEQGWTTRTLGIWNVKDAGGRGHAVFRKTFTVPGGWTNGRVSLWMTSWSGGSFVEKGRVWLDGREVKPMNGDGYIGIGLPSLQPGSTHTMAVESQSRGVLAGLRGQCWISFEPTASQRIDLAGQWLPSSDGLHYETPITLPGTFSTQYLKRTVFIDAKYRGKNAVITIDGDPAVISVLINGKLVRRHHHMLGERGSLNLTPFVRFGEDNEIELVRWGQSDKNSAPSNGAVMRTLREVSLNFFESTVYP